MTYVYVCPRIICHFSCMSTYVCRFYTRLKKTGKKSDLGQRHHHRFHCAPLDNLSIDQAILAPPTLTMPKRRLGYGEVVVGEGTGPQSRTTNPTTSPTTEKKESSSRRQPRRKTAEILLKLSHSCNLHSKSCHSEKTSNDTTIVDDDDRIPLRCENDLENLRNLLPQIELKFRPPQMGEQGPSADDIVHLCAFYNSTMQSLYCPYAPRLFEQGKSMEQGKVLFVLAASNFL